MALVVVRLFFKVIGLAVLLTAMVAVVLLGGHSCQALFENPVAVDADPQALRKAVVPPDQDLELVGVVDGSAKTDAHPGPKKLDSVALAGYPNVLLAVVRRVLPLLHLEMTDRQPGLTA